MLRDSEKELEYLARDRPRSEELRVTSFVDGGVTLEVPRRRERVSWAAWVVAGVIVVAPMVAVPWLRGIPPWQAIPAVFVLMRHSAHSLLRLAEEAPTVTALILSPILWFALRCATANVRARPTVIGISPLTAYIDRPGWLRRRILEIPRRRLLSIRTGR